MAKTIAQLRQEAQTIRDASAVGENTATRVGGAMDDIVDYLDDTTPSNINSASTADLEITDENNHVLLRLENGQIKTKNFDSKDVLSLQEMMENIPVTVDNNAVDDFSIEDENGFSIVRFMNGHIKTKYFDSESIQNSIYAKFNGKKFAIIGDSISTYNGWLPSDIAEYNGTTYATYYPHGNVNSASKTWWYRALVNLGLSPDKNFVNVCAWSGSRVTGDSTSMTSAYSACSDRRVSDLAIRGWNPDIIIIFISCNDWAHDISVGTWQVSQAIPAEGTITDMRSAYAIMLNKIHINYPMARIFCCTILDDYRRDATSGWPSNNSNGISTSEWNQNIKEIADAFGCDVIDMHACGVNYSNIASMAVDEGLHPNANGMELMAQKVSSELLAKY